MSLSVGIPRRVVLLRDRSTRKGHHRFGSHLILVARRIRLQKQTLEYQLLQAVLDLPQRMVDIVTLVGQLPPKFNSIHMHCRVLVGTLRVYRF